jgi:hypothetical protein
MDAPTVTAIVSQELVQLVVLGKGRPAQPSWGLPLAQRVVPKTREPHVSMPVPSV